MSDDDGDETIEASPEAWAELQRQADELQARRGERPKGLDDADDPTVTVPRIDVGFDSDVAGLGEDPPTAGLDEADVGFDDDARGLAGVDDWAAETVSLDDVAPLADPGTAAPDRVEPVDDDLDEAPSSAVAVASVRADTDQASRVADAAPAPREALYRPASAADPPPSSETARSFVEASRAREQQAAALAAPPEQKKPRSALWIILGVFLGAQILAGGLYVALNTLRDEPAETTELAVAEEPEATVEAEEPDDSPAVTPTPGPTPRATPTVVPPTPVWEPVQGGPRSTPFTFFLEAIVREPSFRDARDGDPIELTIDGRIVPLTNPLASGEPLVLRAVGGEPTDEWAQVELPGDGTIAWVDTSEFVWRSTNVLVQVDVSNNTLRVFEGNEQMLSADIATGRRSRPTPQLNSYVIERRAGDQLELIRVADFGGRNAASDGLGVLTISETNDRELLTDEAGYSTDGRILLASGDFRDFAALVSAGSKVEVVGLPTAPTPTPVPTPSRPQDSTQGGFIGCPPATLGSPPNCYRVVDYTTVLGSCSGRQVEIDKQCLLIGGDPEFDDFGRNCTSSAPIEINGLCYLGVGPVPELQGPCPEGSREVQGECREPA